MIGNESAGRRQSESSLVELQTQLKPVLAGCVENLLATYAGPEGLFPYSSRLVHGTIVNDYRRPDSLRYTINTLLGLGRAAKAGVSGVAQADLDGMIQEFVERHASSLASYADLGLLLLLLADNPNVPGETAVDSALASLKRSLSDQRADDFNMQDLAWIIWGCAASVRNGVADAGELGRSTSKLLQDRFVDAATGLPRHSVKRYRRSLVSFGSLSYFLRAMHEAASTFDDEKAARLFEAGVQRTLSLQGPQGEWPWMINVPRGSVVDVYPVFSVHQDSMAMLFLLPALDSSRPQVEDAIIRSLAWVFGRNELGVAFYQYDPFFAFRSIERAEEAPRLRRYVRFLESSVTHRAGGFQSAHTRVNDECRSYHLGWILFAWSERVAALSGDDSARFG